MKGSIRFFLGMLICMVAVEPTDEAPLSLILAVGAIGLAIMASGVKAMKECA